MFIGSCASYTAGSCTYIINTAINHQRTHHHWQKNTHAFNMFRVTDVSLSRNSFGKSLRSLWCAIVWRLVKSHCSHPSMLCQAICFSSKHLFHFSVGNMSLQLKFPYYFQEACHSGRHYSVFLHLTLCSPGEANVLCLCKVQFAGALANLSESIDQIWHLHHLFSLSLEVNLIYSTGAKTASPSSPWF